jgi:IS4 transposase
MKDKSHKFQFEKFIVDIQQKEDDARKKVEDHQAGQEDHPARKYNKLYRERWQNRIKFRRK